MLLDFLDKKIRESFSKAALEYDVLTSLHKEIGRELSKKVVNNDDVATILDVGMGTGWLTNRLSFYLPDSKIIGLDFAPGMTSVAKKKWEDLDILQAHAARLPVKDGRMSIVISNLAYQWVENPTIAFGEIERALKPDGRVFITMFGYDTFKELFESLECANREHRRMPLKRLSKKESVDKALKTLKFSNFRIQQEYIKVRFPNMIGLLKWIKHIGANVLTPKTFMGKQWLKRASQYYEKHFRDRLGIYATFEVLWIEAQK